MSDKPPFIKIDLDECLITLFIFVLIILFFGEPDLWDVILNQLSNGQIPIPAPKP